MSILLKGINLPKDNNKKERLLFIVSGGRVLDPELNLVGEAIDIPTPHGDLIDRDAIDDAEADSEWNELADGYTAFSRIALDAQPIVIEGEE